ncbi:MAG: NAD-dependent epimerase/dehydratase family protein, partial [Chloroflexi bacterium]|nr:NAD-dependent epimerase/dehydratase family protein [Chloroflexota bacterium]
MKVVIAGGTGWLGSALTRSLAADGHEAIVLSRASDRSTPGRLLVWDGRSSGDWVADIEGADAVVNLAGASIAEKRWNPRRKAELIGSRLEPTRALVAAVAMASRRPAVFVQGSAVGYYGNRGDEVLDEDSGPGNDFLAGLVIGWEAAAEAASDLGVRLVVTRTAVVLGPRGGALPRLTLPFRWFIG